MRRKFFVVAGMLAGVLSSMGCAQEKSAQTPAVSSSPQGIPLSEIGEGGKYQLIGKLHQPLGKLCTLQGVAIEGQFKGYEGGPNLQVQRINGVATQELIQIRISPYFGLKGEQSAKKAKDSSKEADGCCR